MNVPRSPVTPIACNCGYCSDLNSELEDVGEEPLLPNLVLGGKDSVTTDLLSSLIMKAVQQANYPAWSPAFGSDGLVRTSSFMEVHKEGANTASTSAWVIVTTKPVLSETLYRGWANSDGVRIHNMWQYAQAESDESRYAEQILVAWISTWPGMIPLMASSLDLESNPIRRTIYITFASERAHLA